VLARFHAACAATPAIAEYGRVEVIARNVEENFAQAQRALSRLAGPERQREVERWQLAFLRERAALFEERRRRGRVRDGHGDLRLEHVYFVPGEAAPMVLDCIEFNERFRYADVCADIAFLSMDLAWHGHALDKERFLAAYARESGDYDLYSLVDFYESYRAYVRAKVAALGLATQSLGFEARERLKREARGYLLLSVAAERPSLLPPRLITVGGVIASGKSTLAEALGYELGLPVVSSDRTRKVLLGVGATEHVVGEAAERAYAPAFTEQVYAEVLRQAQVVLASGRSVIVDASFRSRAARAAVKSVALAAGVPFVFLECRAAESVSRERLAAREGVANVSDARLSLYDDFVARYEAVSELAPAEHARIDTSGTLAQSLRAVQSTGLLPDATP
jgi:predicted kinase